MKQKSHKLSLALRKSVLTLSHSVTTSPPPYADLTAISCCGSKERETQAIS